MERGALLLTWKLTEPITVRLLICLLRRGIVVAVVVGWALEFEGPEMTLWGFILAGFVEEVGLMLRPGLEVVLMCLVFALRKTLPLPVGIF